MINHKLLSERGVTLLEILLVLAISASILIMSIRYYQSATSSLHANNAMEQIQAITATIDHISAGTSYSNVSTPMVKALLPNHTLTTPWGTEVSINMVRPSSYEVTLPGTPVPICNMLRSKLESNNHYQVQTACTATKTDFTYKYLSNV